MGEIQTPPCGNPAWNAENVREKDLIFFDGIQDFQIFFNNDFLAEFF